MSLSRVATTYTGTCLSTASAASCADPALLISQSPLTASAPISTASLEPSAAPTPASVYNSTAIPTAANPGRHRATFVDGSPLCARDPKRTVCTDRLQHPGHRPGGRAGREPGWPVFPGQQRGGHPDDHPLRPIRRALEPVKGPYRVVAAQSCTDRVPDRPHRWLRPAEQGRHSLERRRSCPRRPVAAPRAHAATRHSRRTDGRWRSMPPHAPTCRP